MTADGSIRCVEYDSSITPIFDGLLAEVGRSWPGLEAVVEAADPDVDRPADGDDSRVADGTPGADDGPPGGGGQRDDERAGWFEPNAAAGPSDDQS